MTLFACPSVSCSSVCLSSLARDAVVDLTNRRHSPSLLRWVTGGSSGWKADGSVDMPDPSNLFAGFQRPPAAFAPASSCNSGLLAERSLAFLTAEGDWERSYSGRRGREHGCSCRSPRACNVVYRCKRRFSATTPMAGHLLVSVVSGSVDRPDNGRHSAPLSRVTCRSENTTRRSAVAWTVSRAAEGFSALRLSPRGQVGDRGPW